MGAEVPLVGVLVEGVVKGVALGAGVRTGLGPVTFLLLGKTFPSASSCVGWDVLVRPPVGLPDSSPSPREAEPRSSQPSRALNLQGACPSLVAPKCGCGGERCRGWCGAWWPPAPRPHLLPVLPSSAPAAASSPPLALPRPLSRVASRQHEAPSPR